MAFNFPYDVNEVLGGRARILIAPTTVAVPDDLSDIVDLVSPYAPKTGWEDLGATGGPAQYGRNLTVAGYNIQQSTSAVLEEPQEVTRTIAFPSAEVRPDILAMLEEAGAVETVAAAALRSPQDRVRFGTVVELSSYRLAVIGVRKEVQGAVTEPGGAKRGRLVALVGFNCQISADNAQVAFGEGDMAQVPLSFTFHPDSTLTTSGTEFGMWLTEDSATIAAS